MKQLQEREHFASRLGFLLISAGCAIGLGNVWRFPYITGKYGGAAFVLIYLFFLLILGFPIMVMEFAVGRASRKSCAQSFTVLEPKGTKWHWYGYGAMAGNYLLMMFYTTIGGWMLCYFVRMLRGDFQGLDPDGVANAFTQMTLQPVEMTFWMVVVVLVGFAVCSRGLQKGVEKVNKFMMTCLLLIMVVLAVRSCMLPGAGEGLSFYLKPDFAKMMENSFFEVVFAAMGQAFFTLSLGIGALAVFGSYIGKERSLSGEAINVCLLDTFVALTAGLIIFPACSAYNVNPGEGPSLVFITLPNIFNNMPGGRIWGSLFFLFMSFAAMTTIIAVFENIICFAMDLWGWSRSKAVVVNIVLIIVLSMPALLGYNLLGFIQPLGGGSTILDFEDFLVSNNILPLGSLVYLLFCVSRKGWGWDNFIQEADSGSGLPFPRWVRGYVTWVLPLIVLFVFAAGYYVKFFQ